MHETSDVVTALISAGAGAGLASIVVALINTRSGKSEARAHAADLVATAAGGLADRLTKFNDSLVLETKGLRAAIGALVDVLDEVMPRITATPEDVVLLHEAIKAARLAM